jgi:hypothetical protein
MAAAKNKFSVRYSVETSWSFLTQASHFEDHVIETTENIRDIASRLAREGFEAEGGAWIMPGAISRIQVA